MAAEPARLLVWVNVAGSSTAVTSITTPAFDASGCDFLVAFVENQAAVAACTLSDSTGANTWQALTEQTRAGQARGQLFYAYNPTVSASMTVTATQPSASLGPQIQVMGFKGAQTASDPFDKENGASGSGVSLQPGSITPTTDGQIIVTGYYDGVNNGIPTITNPFCTMGPLPQASGQHYGAGMAYMIQETAAAINPTWTQGSSTNEVAVIASFKAAAAAGGTSPLVQPASPVIVWPGGIARY